MSPHLDWYNGLDEWLKEEIEKIGKIVPEKIA
jgi:hypothetical protein